jgi:YVTN family beta-propeller protein
VVIDTATNSVVGSPIAVGDGSVAIAITPDGTRAYVVNEGSNASSFFGTVSVIDIATNTVVGSQIPVGTAPGAIAITPDGTRAYVTNNRNGFVKDGTVSVINTATNTVIGSPILLGSDPTALDLQGIAITPAGDRAYVTGEAEFTDMSAVFVIDTTTNTVSGSPIPVGQGPSGIAITSDGLRAYVVNDNDGTVSAIDTITNTVLGNAIAVGAAPVGIAITAGPICSPVEITALQAIPNSLRPPNHKMVGISVSDTTSNGCGAVSCQIVNVGSNEPINGLGDGDRAPDWLIAGDLSVNLRAERSGSGTGRTYSITVQCADASGNSDTKVVNVIVPLDQ